MGNRHSVRQSHAGLSVPRRPGLDSDRPERRPTRSKLRHPTHGRRRPPKTGDHRMSLLPARGRRLPPGRINPEAMAAARGGAREGLAWLGRPPEAKASWLYRATRLLARIVLFGVFRFRVETSGRELLPDGGYIVIAAAHR